MDLPIAPLGLHPFGDEQRIDISQGGGNGQVNQQMVVEAVTIASLQNRNDGQLFPVSTSSIAEVTLLKSIKEMTEISVSVLLS